MAIDYNTGINSIDVGAHDITYSGNEGPKSPDQERLMGFDDTPGFELKSLDELISEFEEDTGTRPTSIDDLRRFFYNKYGPAGITKLETAVQQEEQRAQMQQREGIQTASAADDILEEEYRKYVFEMEEQGLEPLSFEEFRQQAVAGMATGGRVGYAGGQLVKSSGDGKRPGYRGDAAYRSKSEQSKSIGQGDVGTSKSFGDERDPKDEAPVVDKSSALQHYNHLVATGQLSDEDYETIEEVPLNKREQILQDFEDTKKEVKGPWFYKFLGSFSDPRKHREYFVNNVLRAGRYPYIIDGKYGTLGYEDIDEMGLEELEKAYQEYMSNRMSGKIDAAGNVSGDYRREIIDGKIVYVPRSGGGDDKAGTMFATTQVPDNQLPTDPGDPADPDPDPGIPTDSINLANLTQDYTDPSFANPWFYGKETITLADGGRAGYAGGGIADLRQGYFLGKLVKKITKGAKKALKNPIIRTALIAGIGAYGLKGMGGGGWNPFSGWGMNALKKGAAKTFLTDPAGGWGSKNWNPWTMIGIPAIAGGLYTAMSGDKDEEPEWLKEWKRKYQAGLTEFAPIGQPETWESIRFADGGRIGYAKGGNDEEGHRSAALSAMYGMRRRAQEGGLMDLGGMEKDYRNEGGFVPIGGEERADDVPARLSKNEFVFTADAVRNAGGGDIDKGAEIMENLMENLEKGGKVSEESQGLEGARDMFSTAQRLEGVM